MASWAELQFDPRLNPSYLHPQDHPDGSIRGAVPADHSPSMRTGYSSYTPHHSRNSSRQTYNSGGLYGPRPQPPPVDPIQGLPTPVLPARGMTELEDGGAVYMEDVEVDPGVDSEPMYQSEFDDEHRSHGKRRFVGGFFRGLRKIPKAVKRGFLPDRRDIQMSHGLPYHQTTFQPPYTSGAQPHEPEDAPPFDMNPEHLEGDLRYVEDMNMPPELMSPSPAGPSRTPSHTIRAPRSESQLTYQSLTNPSARHISHHAPPTTEENETTDGNSLRPSQPPLGSEPPEPGTNRVSPLDPTRRPTVTVQSPTGSPVYIEPERADDYVGMASPVEPPPEPSVPSQFARVGKFFRDLNHLPWVSPNVTVDFDPTDSERARYARSRSSGRSWYTGQLHDLDLLGGGSSSTRRLTAPSGHTLGPAPGSSATLAPHHHHGSGSASSSEGASAHLPAAHALPSSSYPYPVPQLALPPQPFYFYPAAYPTMAPLPPPPLRPPNGAEQGSPQSSGHSDVPRQPYLYVVAMPPAYMTGPVDPSRPMQPAYGVPYPPPI
ncbi:hypothetical protein B0F90DRAFT_1748359 [Multifurca ochricompacta]|uniref:Uncharacterized protein n=1 Tax=Multifurca ochricompacta TaxID=376703 RepID=A0AAD4M1B7_9AGAM|nr:hypothetical protein B0F90DRAFT_1748359 [Multifurca ochricompacta]